jgi:hypothetical protein
MKSAIQACWEGGVLFAKMDEIRGPLWIQPMALFPEAAGSARLRELLAGKNENNVSTFVL